MTNTPELLEIATAFAERAEKNRSQEPPCVIGVALVAMQIQDPFLLIHVSMKRSRRTTDLPPLVPLTAITPIAMAVFPKTRTVSDSGATCSSLPLDDLTLARNSDFWCRRPYKPGSMPFPEQ